MSKKHERNLRFLARVQAYTRIATEALHQAGVSISQIEVGPSIGTVQSAYDNANHRLRDLEAEIAKLERLVCS